MKHGTSLSERMQRRAVNRHRRGSTSDPAKSSALQCGSSLQFPHVLVYYRKADVGRKGTILLIRRRKLVGKVVPVVQTVEG
jgi:hypothetical protein